MMVRRSVAAALALFVGLMAGSCTPFSGYVADHWPHFAGGEPDDLPPRPGAPGYNKFIAHGQPAQTTQSPAAAQPTSTGATATIAKGTPAAADQKPSAFAEPTAEDAKPDTQLAPAAERPAGDSSVVQGGLY
jgi:hypothetical protein